MKTFVQFLKDWTLPVSIGLGAAIYFLFYGIEFLHPAGGFFEPVFNELLPWLMFFVLFVTFCKVDFKQMRLCWWHLWVLVSQVALVLIIMYVLLFSAGQQSDKILWEGILACVICPTASAATVVTVKLGGNLVAMTTYTFMSNFMSALMIPLFFSMIGQHADIAFLDAFFLILKRVVVVLVAPLFMGWLVRHHFKRVQEKIVSIKGLGFYLWGVSLMIVTGITMDNIVHSDASFSTLSVIAISSLAVCLLQFAVGKYIGRFFKSTIDAGQALGQKNTSFAIWVACLYLHPLATVAPGCYILWQNIVNSWELWDVRRKATRR